MISEELALILEESLPTRKVKGTWEVHASSGEIVKVLMDNKNTIVRLLKSVPSIKSKTYWIDANDWSHDGVTALIKGDASNISGDVSMITGDVTEIEGNVSGIKGWVSLLKGDVSKIKGNVFGINGEVSGVTGNVTHIKGDVSRITGDVSLLTGDVTILNGNVSGLKGDVTGIKGDATGISINIDRCGLTLADRRKGVNIKDLVKRSS
jgi:hypothetical protein